jgi:hypothetical protein
VRGGEVRGLDSAGNVLFSGRTGEDGKICFPMPEQAEDIEFAVLAGEGHRGTFSLRAADIAPFLGGEKEREVVSLSVSGGEGGENPAPARADGENGELRENPALENMLRRAVREEVQAQLSRFASSLPSVNMTKAPAGRRYSADWAGFWALPLWPMPPWPPRAGIRKDRAFSGLRFRKS